MPPRRSRNKQVSEMTQYPDQSTRRIQFGNARRYVRETANKLHDETGGNVAFVAVAENNIVLEHAIGPGMSQLLNQHGYVPRAPAARFGVTADELNNPDLDADELQHLVNQAQATALTIAQEEAQRIG